MTVKDRIIDGAVAMLLVGLGYTINVIIVLWIRPEIEKTINSPMHIDIDPISSIIQVFIVIIIAAIIALLVIMAPRGVKAE